MMRFKRNNLSLQEMESLVKVREMIREQRRRGDADSAVLAGVMEGMEPVLASLVSLLEARRNRLKKVLAAVVRERQKVAADLNATNLSDPANIERMHKLENMINEYICLNEGLGRARGERKPITK